MASPSFRGLSAISPIGPLLFDGLNLALVAALALRALCRAASVWCAAPGAACCGRFARTNARRPRSARARRRYRLQAFALGGAIMGLGGAVQAHFIGFIAPDNYLSSLTFLVWTMLIIGGSGNNRGAILGGVPVWALWSALGRGHRRHVSRRAASARLRLADRRDRRLSSASMLLARPRGLIGERAIVSRHLDE